MFNFKKKVHFIQVNDFLYKEFEELFFPIQKMLLTKDAANFKLSNIATNAILYELFFFFIYTIHTSEEYTNDEYLEDLFKRFLSFFKPSLKLEINEYTKRFSEIDEVMNFAVTHAQNSGGVGSAIVGFIVHKLPDSILNEITITRDDELEKMFGVEVGEGKNDDIFIYLPLLIGVLVGEMNIRFAKDIENYFKKHKMS